jgi:carbonic anhydrase
VYILFFGNTSANNLIKPVVLYFVKTLKHLLKNNRNWSEKVRKTHPTFFADLSEQQTPEYVWIGCSDSRVSASNIVGLLPGEVFVHRNIANLVIHTDMNCLSVLQFAVEVLQVKHIIVCGHYGCGGVKAALEDKRHGLIDNWLRHIQDVANLYEDVLSEIDDADKKLNKLCELNVIEQVLNVGETTIVQDAWKRGQELRVHGWIYDLSDGIITDLGIHLENSGEVKTLRRRFLT